MSAPDPTHRGRYSFRDRPADCSLLVRTLYGIMLDMTDDDLNDLQCLMGSLRAERGADV